MFLETVFADLPDLRGMGWFLSERDGGLAPQQSSFNSLHAAGVVASAQVTVQQGSLPLQHALALIGSTLGVVDDTCHEARGLQRILGQLGVVLFEVHLVAL